MRKVKINDNDYFIEEKNNRTYLNDELIDFDIQQINKENYHIIVENKSINVKVIAFDPSNQKIRLSINEEELDCYLTGIKDKVKVMLNQHSHSHNNVEYIMSPMPGLIQKILVSEGDKIVQGKPLIILNAMKMENVIKAPREGKIGKILIKEADQVEKGKVLIQF